jgi:hypothetical protein
MDPHVRNTVLAAFGYLETILWMGRPDTERFLRLNRSAMLRAALVLVGSLTLLAAPLALAAALGAGPLRDWVAGEADRQTTLAALAIAFLALGLAVLLLWQAVRAARDLIRAALASHRHAGTFYALTEGHALILTLGGRRPLITAIGRNGLERISLVHHDDGLSDLILRGGPAGELRFAGIAEAEAVARLIAAYLLQARRLRLRLPGADSAGAPSRFDPAADLPER